MRKLIAASRAVFATLGPASAFAQKVNTDYDPAFNFTSVKTYFWAKTTKLRRTRLPTHGWWSRLTPG